MSIYNAVYSGIPVYEMMMRNVAVMRRKSDSYLNATQILKVAGIDKGRRTKILEKEVQVGEHEKVQGGYGKYQGTWIPFEKGIEVARAYQVDHLLRPLLEYVSHGNEDVELPKKKPKVRPKSEQISGNDVLMGSSNDLYPPMKKIRGMDGGATQMHALMHADPGYFQGNNDMSRSESATLVQPHAPLAMPQFAYKPGERHRPMLMSMFLSDNAPIPNVLTTTEKTPDFDVDLIIDDQGHTSLHWAAALARTSILQALLQKGADPTRLNYNGESALVRAVLVTNNFDYDTFPEILACLYPALIAQDKKQRTILHHIALTAGVKGRMQASRYYLEALLAFLRAPPSQIMSKLEGITHSAVVPGPSLLSKLVNIQDKNGDTALNIATRIGNKYIVEGLERVGADGSIANKAGLRPIDCKEKNDSPTLISSDSPNISNQRSKQNLDKRISLVHKLADLSAAIKNVTRLRSEATDLKLALEAEQQSTLGIDFTCLESDNDAAREALRRKIALLTELCEQNGVLIPPLDGFRGTIVRKNSLPMDQNSARASEYKSGGSEQTTARDTRGITPQTSQSQRPRVIGHHPGQLYPHQQLQLQLQQQQQQQHQIKKSGVQQDQKPIPSSGAAVSRQTASNQNKVIDTQMRSDGHENPSIAQAKPI